MHMKSKHHSFATISQMLSSYAKLLLATSNGAPHLRYVYHLFAYHDHS